MKTVAEEVASWVAELRYEMLPNEVVNRTKLILLDTLGCALGALRAPPVQMARQVALEQGGNPQATPIGVQWKTSCDQAAFIDGMALRYLDLNDYTAAGSHPSINVAAALTTAEAQGLTGRDLILGTTIGYELQLRLRDATKGGSPEGWDHSTYVHYSTAAVAAKLFGLPAPKIAHAVAIAGSHASTLGAVRKGKLSMWKGAAEPMGAKSGIFAAILARAGLTGPLAIFEGAAGYGEVVAGALDEDALRRRPKEFHILQSCVKIWPCVYVAQAPIAAALRLRSHRDFKSEHVGKVVVYLSDIVYEQQKKFLEAGLSTRESADHSVPYCVARALLDGEVWLDDFEEKRFTEPRALELLGKISLKRGDDLPERAGARVEIHFRGGSTLSETLHYPPGHTANPIGEDEAVKKFRALAELVLERERTDEVCDMVLRIDEASNIDALLKALSTAATPG